MSTTDHGRSIPDLLGGLATDITTLFRKEVQLAKAEASEKLDVVLGSVQKLAIGAVLGIAAAGVLMAAIVSGVAALFVGMGMDPTLANSLSAIIVAAIVGAVAWSLIKSAIAAMKAEKLNMNRTVHSLSQDAQVVTEKL